MSASAELTAHALDLFAGLGPLRTARMFSGVGIYAEGDAMFAMIQGDTIWLKADDSNRAALLAAGARPFIYRRKDGAREVPSFLSLPEAAMDDAEAALEWARGALPAARAAALEKRRQKARRAAPRPRRT